MFQDKTGMNRLPSIVPALLGMILPLVLLSCGGGTEDSDSPANRLRVKILTTADDLNQAPLEELLRQYANENSAITLETRVEPLALDALVQNASSALGDADVLIFPSLAAAHFRSQVDSFYPLAAPDLTFPQMLHQAYVSSASDSFWALPLLIDPLVMISKKSASERIGIQAPQSWSEISLIHKVMTKTPPNQGLSMVFLTGNPQRLADAFAAIMLTWGYGKYDLREDTGSRPDWYSEEKASMEQAIRNLRAYLQPGEEPLVELPQTSNLQSFIDSNAALTFSRLSEFNALPPERKDLLYGYPIPSHERVTAPACVTLAAVPLSSQNPELAEPLVKFLINRLSSSDNTSLTLRTLPANRWQAAGGLARPFPDNAIFLPRESIGSLSEKAVLDFLNGKMSIDKINELWANQYYPEIPQKTSAGRI